jgi:hypothetical protein
MPYLSRVKRAAITKGAVLRFTSLPVGISWGLVVAVSVHIGIETLTRSGYVISMLCFTILLKLTAMPSELAGSMQ